MEKIYLFNYNFKRYFTNKNFIIMSGIEIILAFLLNILIFSLGEFALTSASIVLFVNMPLSILFISFVNINGIVNIIINDDKSGIQGLEIRRGIKPREIFIYKTLALKLINWLYIFLIWILFLISVSFFNLANANYIVTSLSIGFFSLFAYDIFIFGVTIAICLFSKSNKKTLSFGWILSIIFAFSVLLGPIGFAFTNSSEAETTSNLNYLSYTLNKETENNGFVEKIRGDFETLQSDYVESFTVPDRKTDSLTFDAFHYFSNIAFESGGLYLEFNNILNTNNSALLAKYFVDPSSIAIDKEKILNRTEESLVYHFLDFFSQGVSGDNKKNFSNSFYNKISTSNVKKSNQLNDILNNFKKEKWSEFIQKDEVLTFGLTVEDFNEVLVLNRTIKNIYFDYLSLYSNSLIIRSGLMDSVSDFYSDSANWVNEMKYSFGTHLYSLILFTSLNSTTSSNFTNFAGADGIYKYNPLMWFYEMMFFSGRNTFVDDNKVLMSTLLPLHSFRPFVLDENDEMIPTSRPFNVVLNYFIFIISGVSLILISYAYFGKRIYSRAGLE